MITREADYAIRVCLYLARQPAESGAVATADMARAMDIPYRFLRKLVMRLAHAGVITSRRGKGGGVRLARDPGALTLLEVVRSVAPESTWLNRCLVHGEACTRSPHCAIRSALQVVQDTLDHQLGSLTFNNLC